MQVLRLAKYPDIAIKLDDDNFEKLKDKPWYVNAYGMVSYTDNSRTEGKNVLLHRLIIECPSDKYVAYLNGDKYDLRKSNLTLVSSKSAVYAIGKSGKKDNYRSAYRGVTYVEVSKRKKKWRAQISLAKHTTLGYFATEEEAAWMYDQFASQAFEEYSPNLDYAPAPISGAK